MKENVYDVIVIGGGPAGMIAAGRASERGLETLLLEKNDSLGKKLLITGGGRCNVTNNKPDLKTLVSSYKDSPNQLYSLFSQFGVNETLTFFNSRDMETKVEEEGRIFPLSNKSQSVWDVLVDFMSENNVEIESNSEVIDIKKNKNFEVKTKNDTFYSKSCIVATGGVSYPETGSTGDGFKWLANLGHKINENDFSLVPLATNDSWVKNLSGLSLQDVKISVTNGTKRIASKKGKVLFTHFGLSGPGILNLSSTVRDVLDHERAYIEIDLLPEIDNGKLKSMIYEMIEKDPKKMIKNSLSILVTPKLILPILHLSEINPEKTNYEVTREERLRLLNTIKALRIKIERLLGAKKAIVSSGGVDINEVNFKTMESKVVQNLFIVGDLLDIDRPSGGYSLQICWASGYIAGENC